MVVPSFPILKEHGIRIEEDPGDITPLPQYANDLRRLLLTFKEIVPFNRKSDLMQYHKKDNDLSDKKLQLNDTIFCDSNHRAYQARWDAALELRDKAIHLQNRQREDAWNGLMSNFVFEVVNYQASEWVDQNLFSWGSDELFTNAVPIRGRFPDGKDYPPKPDFWFGLGLYNDQQLSRLRGLELKDKGIQHFKQEGLKDMNKTRTKTKRLIYQPVGTRSDAAFPWMVVELKHESGDEKECIRQAANASHASLKLCERLAAKANMPAAPIVAFTSVGPRVKIFIAYKSEKDEESEEEDASEEDDEDEVYNIGIMRERRTRKPRNKTEEETEDEIYEVMGGGKRGKYDR
ncbi:MAG: hypothetical protein Q9163_000766 [Psora crenata]